MSDDSKSKITQFVSPDPRIKLTTSGGGSSVSFIRKDDGWYQSTSPGSALEPYSGPVDLTRDDNGLVNVVVSNRSSQSYDRAGSMELVALESLDVPDEPWDGTPGAGFEVRGENQTQFEFRLTNATLPAPTRPLNQYYYIRTATKDSNGDYLFAGRPTSYNGTMTIQAVTYGSVAEEQLQWLFLPRSQADTSSAVSLFFRNPTTWNQQDCRFILCGSGNGAPIQLVNWCDDDGQAGWTWNGEAGTLSNGNRQYWMASSSSGAVTSGVVLGWSANNESDQQWNLIPATLGPLGEGRGILGPTVG